MKYFKASHLKKELESVVKAGHPRGEFTGFKPLNEIFTLKKGYPLFIAGLPHAGKSEFVLEVLLNTSVRYGWKHFIYSGESGSVAEIISELAHKLISKPYRDGTFAMTEKERLIAEMFINDHFVFMDTDMDFTVSEFYQFVQEAEQEYGFKFDTTTIDPFNDVKEELSEYGGREDKWLRRELKRIRIMSKKNNRIDILVNHVADIKPVYDKDSNAQYTPVPLPSQWAGGRTWHRRAFTMLVVYRPAIFMKNENGEPYLENETLIINQKAKPKGTGKIGRASLFFDWKKNRYYWNEMGKEQFAFKLNQESKFVANSFLQSQETDMNDLPF